MSLQATTPTRHLPGDGQQTQVRVSSPGNVVETIARMGDMTIDDDSDVSYQELVEPSDNEGWSLAEALKAAKDTLPQYMKVFDEAMEGIKRQKAEMGEVALAAPKFTMDGPVAKKVFDDYAEYLIEQREEVEEMESRFYSRCTSVEGSQETGSAAYTSDSSVDIIDSGFGTDWMEINACSSSALIQKSRSVWDGTDGSGRKRKMDDSELLEESAWEEEEMSDSGRGSSDHSRSQRFRRIESSTGSSDADSGIVSVDTNIKTHPAPLSSWGGRKTENTRKTRGSKRSEKIMHEAGNSFVKPGVGGSSKKSRKSTRSRSPSPSPSAYGTEFQYRIDDNIYYSYDFIFKEGIRRSKEAKSQGLEKPYFCPVPDCDRTYKNANGLKYHAQYGHSPKQVFACEICDKTYGTKHGLNAHKKVHMKRCDVPRISPFKLVLV